MTRNEANEHAGAVLGVNGRFFSVVTWPESEARHSGNIANQKWISESRPMPSYGPRHIMRVEIRHDDQCKNGHETFAITAEVYRPGARDIDACGCLHDKIREVFPELATLIDWHLWSTDGPMHAEANGWYWLAGAAGGLQQQYHGANDSRHSADDCVRIFAEYFGLPESEARHVINKHADLALEIGPKAARQAFGVWVSEYLPGALDRFRRTVEGAGFMFDANAMVAA